MPLSPTAYTARALGLRLGAEQRKEHERLMSRVSLGDAALHALARLAWKFDAQSLQQPGDDTGAIFAFVAAYKQGYRRGDLT